MGKLEILAGMRRGSLTVQREVERDNQRTRRFECLCDCGKLVALRKDHILSERKFCSPQCSLLSVSRKLDLIGKTINRWTVIEYAGQDKRRTMWKASCSCGTVRTISGASLLIGQTKSCGCLLKDMRRTGRTEQEEIEIKRLRSKLSSRKNPARVKANKIKYETKRNSATPKWLTEACIETMNAIYEAARRLTLETGIKHQVDHIIPINGDTVSGLHVPTNLQILTQAENVSKSNIYAELLGD
jgi:5-methylcytosine-specific restriction endonuclease McrA